MGFFNGLGRLLQGKDVFENPGASHQDDVQAQSQNPQPKQSQFVDEHGYKIIPDITLDHIKAHRMGDKMIVAAWATNHSSQRVQVDHFSCLGQKQVYRWELSSQGHDVKIYDGPMPSNEHDSHAELTFHLIENGDEFKNVYHVEFNREADGKFVIEELHHDGPVNDI